VHFAVMGTMGKVRSILMHPLSQWSASVVSRATVMVVVLAVLGINGGPPNDSTKIAQQ